MITNLRLTMLAAIVVGCIFNPFKINAQSGGCFEIKSILVDACGTPEGENEMVRFDVGTTSLNVSNMMVTWPNNTFQGLCQNPNTAAIVSAVNQGILGCGSLVEPVGGVLPANAKVLLLTSANINTMANTFVNLNDDVIVLFQCAGNTSGHFANYNIIPGLRTLSIQFTGAGGCTDSVTYDRTLLVNQFGLTGGFSFDNDGAFVDFTAGGIPTYLNNGCQVLSTGLSLTAGPDIGICPGSGTTATLTGAAVNIVGNPQWNGGTGAFSNANSLTTTYTPGAGETGLVYLTLTGNGPCNAVITDTVRVNIVTSLPVVTISPSVTGIFSSNITDPTYYYNWYFTGSANPIPGAYAPMFTPNTNGCYYMLLTTIGGCTVASDSLCITNVGLSDIESSTYMYIIGNPGSSPMIQLDMNAKVSGFNMQLIDIYGRVLQNKRIVAHQDKIEISPEWKDVAAGVYVVRLFTNEWKLEGRVLLTK